MKTTTLNVLSRPLDRQFMERELEIIPDSLPGKQLDLAYAMSEISEEFNCASWVSGCEFEIWRMVTGGDLAWFGGSRKVAPEDIAEIKRLSEATGGWIIDGEHFVPLDQWLHSLINHG